MIKLSCYSCGQELAFSSKIGRRDECHKCHSDIHVCKNCLHHDEHAYNECKEIQAERVREKDKSNFCDYFTPFSKNQTSNQNLADDIKAKAEALLKKLT